MDNILFKNSCFTWYNLEHPGEELLTQYLEKLSLNVFTIQDAMEPGHLPKFEHQDNFDFILIRFFGKENRNYTNIVREFSHKIGIFIGRDFVLTVHQKPVTFWPEVLKHIETDANPDALTPKLLFYKIYKYTMLTFLPPAIRISEAIDNYESNLFTNFESKIELKNLYNLKRESSTCSKILIQTRDVLNEYKAYVKSVSSFNDLLELNNKFMHLHQQNTEDIQNLFTLTISVSDQRANDIMKILTIFSAFFLPLSFIAGVYGMNFQYMPELTYKWGYFAVLGLMLGVVIFIFSWFKRKKFL